MVGFIEKVAVVLSLIQGSQVRSVIPLAKQGATDNVKQDFCAPDELIDQFVVSNNNAVSVCSNANVLNSSYLCCQEYLVTIFIAEFESACFILDSLNCVTSPQVEKAVSAFEQTVTRMSPTLAQHNQKTQYQVYGYGDGIEESGQIPSVKKLQSSVARLISKSFEDFECTTLGNLNKRIRSLNNKIQLLCSNSEISIPLFDEFRVERCTGTLTFPTATTMNSLTPSTALIKRNLIQSPSYMSTRTAKGKTCTPDYDKFQGWYTANREIIVALNLIDDWAGSQTQFDSHSLATSLIEAITSARFQMEQLKCLIPNQSADMFAGLTQVISHFTNTLSKLKQNAATNPGVADLVKSMVQDGIEALNYYIESFSSLLQEFPEDYSCLDIRTINSIITRLNDMLDSLSSCVGISGPSATKVHVNNCKDPTTTTTTTTLLSSIIGTSEMGSTNTFSTKVSSSILTESRMSSKRSDMTSQGNISPTVSGVNSKSSIVSTTVSTRSISSTASHIITQSTLGSSVSFSGSTKNHSRSSNSPSTITECSHYSSVPSVNPSGSPSRLSVSSWNETTPVDVSSTANSNGRFSTVSSISTRSNSLRTSFDMNTKSTTSVSDASSSGDVFSHSYSGLSIFSSATGAMSNIVSSITSISPTRTRVKSRTIGTTSHFDSKTVPLPTNEASFDRSSRLFPNFTPTSCDETKQSSKISRNSKTLSTISLTTSTFVTFSSTGFTDRGSNTCSFVNSGSGTTNSYKEPLDSIRANFSSSSISASSTKKPISNGIPSTRTGADSDRTVVSVTQSNTDVNGGTPTPGSGGSAGISTVKMNDKTTSAVITGSLKASESSDTSTDGILSPSTSHYFEIISTFTTPGTPHSGGITTQVEWNGSEKSITSTNSSSGDHNFSKQTGVEHSTATIGYGSLGSTASQSYGCRGTLISDFDACYSSLRGGSNEVSSRTGHTVAFTSSKVTDFYSLGSSPTVTGSDSWTPTPQPPSNNGASSAPSPSALVVANMGCNQRPATLLVTLCFVAILINNART